jgi:hypothetical protein
LGHREIIYIWNSREKPSGLLRHEEWDSQTPKTKTFLSNALISMNIKDFALAENQRINTLALHDFRSLSANFPGFHLTLHAHHLNSSQLIKLVRICLLPES